jgi:hypothetical protein
MQFLFVLVIISVISIFTFSEMSRNNNEHVVPAFKAGNLADNIFQYQNLIMHYILTNYDTLHLPIAENMGNVEQIKVIHYTDDKIGDFNQKDYSPYLNYQSVVFKYSRILSGESQPMPVLYVATSWDGYSSSDLAKSYADTKMVEVLGKLGQNLSEPLYQGNSTYWIVPWVFSQKNCIIDELYSQLPDNTNNNSQFGTLQKLFKEFCIQIQANSQYTFMKYVYITPVFTTPDM